MPEIRFDNTYARLPERFFARVAPQAASAPRIIKFNRELARALQLAPELTDADVAARMFAGASVPEGAEPIAMAYAGHQFGHFTPQLGDGRAILLGEVVDAAGARRDIQLKGAGRTPFSRGGDGRAALGPVLREYIVSEAMAALGIPTTRALAAATTGDEIWREDILPGAVLTRVAASHIRIGTFQFFASRGDDEAVRSLADYVIDRHYPEAAGADNRYLAMYAAVVARQAKLVAQWMCVGFIHGVMNTDNMSISGETIDYGPCAFMDAYDPATVFSSIDEYGRYAYQNQPAIAHWNLARLVECLLPLLSDDKDRALGLARGALAAFPEKYETAYFAGLRRKLGISTERDGDRAMATDFLDLMAANKTDFTATFRALSDETTSGGDGRARDLFMDLAGFDAWAARWRERLALEPGDVATRRAEMRAANPVFIPRNHRVEAVIAAAVERQDFAPFEELLTVLATPFEDQPAFAHYADPPPPSDVAYRTFCGT